ncbi:MAG: M16 family metallopeptidase [Thermoplasmata archaeon]
MPPSVGPTGTVLAETLPNGIRVLLAPQPEAVTVSVWVWYRIGSRNEVPGRTGASHWVEHMMFNGSPSFPKGSMDRAVMEVGGYLNAFTDVDFTAYLTTVPAEHADLPLRIEADRMTRARMTAAEVERERAIVLAERDGNENWPEFKAEEELYELAFRRHPYRWDPLGWREDIRTMDAPALAEYYRTFYRPRNATLVVAGRFEPGAMRARIRKLFRPLEHGGDAPRVPPAEPTAQGERRATLRGPGTTPFLLLGFRSPAVNDPATPATVLLDTLLGGETRLFASSAWGRSGEHPSARLYRRLVVPGLAIRATCEWRPRSDPGLFTFHVQAAVGVSVERLEKALLDELEAIARAGPTAQELREIRQKVRVAAAMAYEGPTRTAFRLGYFSLLGDRGYERRLLEEILTTPARSIQKQARALFRAEGRNVVRFEPSGGPRGG